MIDDIIKDVKHLYINVQEKIEKKCEMIKN